MSENEPSSVPDARDMAERHRLFWEPQKSAQIFARDIQAKADAPLRRIERGEANALRAETRAGRYACPVDGCPRPAFTTRGGTRRDSFAHLPHSNVNHAPESIDHITAKNVLAEWLRKDPCARVEVDPPDLVGNRRPDVRMKTPNGRFAFEVQYAGLIVETWERRHLDMRSAGYVDTWLFGHTPRHLRKVQCARSLVSLGRLHVAVLAAGLPLFWIDPYEELIATAMPNEALRDRLARGGMDVTSFAFEIGIDRLLDCAMECGAQNAATRFVTPSLLEHERRVRFDLARKVDREVYAAKKRARQALESARREAAAKAARDAMALAQVATQTDAGLVLSPVGAASTQERGAFRLNDGHGDVSEMTRSSAFDAGASVPPAEGELRCVECNKVVPPRLQSRRHQRQPTCVCVECNGR